jgi:hypothetical protein
MTEAAIRRQCTVTPAYPHVAILQPHVRVLENVLRSGVSSILPLACSTPRYLCLIQHLVDYSSHEHLQHRSTFGLEFKNVS